MNLDQLKAQAKMYGCPVDTHKVAGTLTLIIYAPGYQHQQRFQQAAFEQLQEKDVQTILEKLSGKRIRELWTGGKGGGR